MQVSIRTRSAGAAALGIGVAALLAACGANQTKNTGPMSGFTSDLIKRLHPDAIRGAQQLSLASDSVLRITDETGRFRGVYDGTRLLAAADAHAHGTPAITDPALDVRGDGTATFNELRQVVRHFDANASDDFDVDEVRAFEAEVGIRWIPA